ncbi:hypothetical protein ACMFMG_006914 [Clarireedia jacksonii]
MAAYDFPGVDFSLPFHPAPHNISVHSPFEYSSPKPYLETPHDYDSEVHPLRDPEFSPEALSFYRSSSSSSATSRSSLCSSVSPLTPEPLKENDARMPGPINTQTRNSAPVNSKVRNSASVNSKVRNSAPVNSKVRNSGPRHFGLRRSTPSHTTVIVSRPINAGRIINTGATEFPHFTSLPLDIQRRIWKHTLPPPRIIELHHHDRAPIPCSPQKQPPASLSSTLPLPVALRIYRLSRRVALTHYSALSLCHPYYLPALPYAYIDYSRDTIYLSAATVYENLGTDILYSRNLHQIRVLALDFKVWVRLLGDNHFVNALLEMEGLEGLEVIFEREVLASISRRRGSARRAITGEEENGGLHFSAVKNDEMSELEEVFERECEKCWLWGRVKGWEDVRAKLRFRWKDEGGFIDDEELEEDDVYGYRAVETSNKSVKGLGIAMRKESVDLSVQSLLLSVDDVLEEYGAMDSESADGNGHGDWEYSESEYSVEEEEEEEELRGEEVRFGAWGRAWRGGVGKRVLPLAQVEEGEEELRGEETGFGAWGKARVGKEALPLTQVEEGEDERDWDYGFEGEDNWI